MAKIASKQLIRAGDLATLQEKLIERELGLCTTDRLLYVKYGDELIPAGDGAIPVPTSKSLFMGEEDGTSDWTSVVKAESPYDENIELWVSLDDVKFAAEMAYKDAEGHDIKSSMFQAYTSSGRAEPPVYAPVNLEKKMGTGLVVVRMGSGNDLGAIIPITPPDVDGEFAPGDVLVAKTNANPPFPVWKHPDTFPVENSKDPTTSGAVYGVRHLIDPNLYDPNTGEDLRIEGSGLSYEAGKYYVFDDSPYKCTSASSSVAEFTRVDGLVRALNDTLDDIPKVVVYDYELDTNKCRAPDGSFVKASDVLSDMGEGKTPLLLVRSTRGGTVQGSATAVSGASTVVFRESPSGAGSFNEYSNNLYSDTDVWTVTTKTIAEGNVEFIRQASFSDITDIINAGKLPVMKGVAGQGDNYFFPMWTGSGLQFVNVGIDGEIRYYNMPGSGAQWVYGRAPGLFVATYNNTSYLAIQEALDAHKLVMLIGATAYGGTKKLVMTLSSVEESSSYNTYKFSTAVEYSGGNGVVFYATLQNTTWSQGSITLAGVS